MFVCVPLGAHSSTRYRRIVGHTDLRAAGTPRAGILLSLCRAAIYCPAGSFAEFFLRK